MLLCEWRETLRDQLEEGILFRPGYDSLLTQAEIKGNLGVLKQLMELDYDSLVAAMEDM